MVSHNHKIFDGSNPEADERLIRDIMSAPDTPAPQRFTVDPVAVLLIYSTGVLMGVVCAAIFVGVVR